MNINNVLTMLRKNNGGWGSLKHCHTPNVSSIILDHVNGQLTRCFLAWPNHNLWMNNNKSDDAVLSVGYHDHKYDLDILALTDNVYNVEVDLNGNDTWLQQYSVNTKLKTNYQKISILAGSTPEFTRHGKVLASYPKSKKITDLFIKNYEVHTIYVPYGEKACWLVKEGPNLKRGTKLLTPSNSYPVSNSGLYETFKYKVDVIRHFKEWMDI